MKRAVILIHAPVEMDSTVKAPPPLGLLYIAAVLRSHDFHVEFFDFHHEKTTWADVEAAVASTDACLAGFSCSTNNLFRVLHLSDRLLDRFPHVTIALGGPHVTQRWAPYVKDRRMVIRDEGEWPMLQLAKYVLSGEGTLTDVPSLVWRSDSEIRTNPISLGPFENINAIPFPDYSLLPDRDFYIPSIITARGCPHHCFFCCASNLFRRHQRRSAENVERELRLLKEFYGGEIRYLAFLDDTFTASEERLLELCDVVDRVFPDKSRFSFCCEARVDVLARRPSLIERMRRAGLVGMQVGLESGNQEFLDAMNKHTSCEDIESVIIHCEEYDIPFVAGNFIFGLPYQNRDDIEREIEYAKRLTCLAPKRLELTVKALMPYPGSEYGDHPEKWGLTIIDEDFASGRIHSESFLKNSSLAREDIEDSCRRFRAIVGDFALRQAAPLLSPREYKALVVLTAETSQPSFVLSRLSCFTHIARLVLLRRRYDHRFLYEIEEGLWRECAPVAIPENITSRCEDGYVVNRGSPFEFLLKPQDMKYYRCFVGKLTFGEIAARVAMEEGTDVNQALEDCLSVYQECEDSLAAVALL